MAEMSKVQPLAPLPTVTSARPTLESAPRIPSRLPGPWGLSVRIKESQKMTALR